MGMYTAALMPLALSCFFFFFTLPHIAVAQGADGSCAGDCGGNGGGCWCDRSCTSHGDCCSDHKRFCQIVSTLGQPCRDTSTQICDGGLACDVTGNQCKTIRHVGESCSDTTTQICAEGLACDLTADQCRIPLGNPGCSEDEHCVTSTVCDPSDNTCRIPLGNPGCSRDEQCVTSTVCDPSDNTCRIPLGDRCATNPDWCESGTTCDFGLNECHDNLCVNDTAAGNCWHHADGLVASHVSVGPSGVWALTTNGAIYYRGGSYQDPLQLGTTWAVIDGMLIQLDVGHDLLTGINSVDTFYRQGISSSIVMGTFWENSLPDTKWISVSPGGSLWARSMANEAAYYDGSSFQGTGLNIQSVDAGQAGVWALDTSGKLHYRMGTYGDTGSMGTGWQEVDSGPYQSVASGKDVVVTADMEGSVWIRSGVRSNSPTGQDWQSYPGILKQLDVYQTSDGLVIWGRNAAGHVFHSVIMTDGCCITS